MNNRVPLEAFFFCTCETGCGALIPSRGVPFAFPGGKKNHPKSKGQSNCQFFFEIVDVWQQSRQKCVYLLGFRGPCLFLWAVGLIPCGILSQTAEPNLSGSPKYLHVLTNALIQQQPHWGDGTLSSHKTHDDVRR